MLITKFIFKILSSLKKNLLYIINLLIKCEMYIYNLKDLAKKNLLDIADLLINNQLFI